MLQNIENSRDATMRWEVEETSMKENDRGKKKEVGYQFQNWKEHKKVKFDEIELENLKVKKRPLLNGEIMVGSRETMWGVALNQGW